MKNKRIGILGGMGSLATAHYFLELTKQTKASDDQHYHRVIIDSHAQIPDRTDYILFNGEDPLPYLKESVTLLNQANITHGFMPCFTAHYFIEELSNLANFEFVSVFDVLRDMLKKNTYIKTIGIIATTATKEVGIFEKYCHDVSIVYPNKIQQTAIMKAIYDDDIGIKSNQFTNETYQLINDVSIQLLDQDVDILIAGCTEIGVVIKHLDHQDKWLDPMMLVIEKLV